MPRVEKGHFSRRKRGGRQSTKYREDRDRQTENFFGICERAFMDSVANEQQAFTRHYDQERVKILVTYIICRVKERMREGPRVDDVRPGVDTFYRIHLPGTTGRKPRRG